jgi:hypothetical protein
MSDACVAVSASSYLVGASAFELHTFTHRRWMSTSSKNKYLMCRILTFSKSLKWNDDDLYLSQT